MASAAAAAAVVAAVSDADAAGMGLALAQGELALACGEVPIGCVFVHPTTRAVLAAGQNRTNVDFNPTRHAELVAVQSLLDAGGDVAQLAGSHLYVTIEPCIMCASTLAGLRVGRAVYGAPNVKFGGCGSVLPLHTGVCRGGSGGGAGCGGGGGLECRTCDDRGEDGAGNRAAAQAAATSVGEGGGSTHPPIAADGGRDGSAAGCRLFAPFAVTPGVRASEAVALLQRFYARGNARAPPAKANARRAGASAAAAAMAAEAEAGGGSGGVAEVAEVVAPRVG